MPRLPISTEVVKNAAFLVKRLFPVILRLHLVGSRLRHKYGRDIDFVAVIKDPSLAGMNKTVKFGSISVNLFTANPSNVEAAILEYGLGMDVKRWKRAAKDRGFKLNRYGLWRKGTLISSKMDPIAGLLGMALKPSLVYSLDNPL
jgi:DNA polymerase/3'-5' exonuclease PolX